MRISDWSSDVCSSDLGAAYELDGAIIANPYDPDAVAEALQMAAQMTLDERCERWRAMMKILRRNNITAWRESFLRALGEKDRKSVGSGKSVSERVDLGGGRIVKKKNSTTT